MITPVARISSAQLTTLESMTVLAEVIVHGPAYGVRLVPAGTPVLLGPGKHPPMPSEPPGTLAVALHPPAAVGEEEVAVGAGAATVVVFEGLLEAVDRVGVAVGEVVDGAPEVVALVNEVDGFGVELWV